MFRQTLPCPHCAQPIPFGFGGFRPRLACIDGICAACLRPYRFGSRARLAAVASCGAFSLVCVLAYLLLAQGEAYLRAVSTPAFTLVPIVLVFGALCGAAVSMQAAVGLYAARAVRVGTGSLVLAAVDDEEAPFGRTTQRSHPFAAVSAALLLLAMLCWATTLEVRGLREQLETQAAAGKVPAGTTAAFWAFLALDLALTIVIIASLATVLRRLFGTRITGGVSGPEQS